MATTLEQFVSKLDHAVGLADVSERCQLVKGLLEQTFRNQADILAPEFCQPAPDKYARRLVHRDPEGRYSVVAMVWDIGQGTPLHDHDGEWCVECVYRGLIRVTSYDLEGSPDAPLVKFSPQESILAGEGEAGALIPPYEYHTIENALTDSPSVTVHVYGHELTHCHIFVPEDEGYRRESRALCYTS